MEIILSKQCESLTGTLGRGFGYYIKPHLSLITGEVRYFSQRSKHQVPQDGHLRFIITCANLAQMKLHITDIRVSRKELMFALREAGREALGDYVFAGPDKLPEIFTATDILKLKKDFNL